MRMRSLAPILGALVFGAVTLLSSVAVAAAADSRGALSHGDLARVRTDRVDLAVDRTISPVGVAEIAAAAEQDVAAVEVAFDRRFSARPVVYVFATPDAFARALRDRFGYEEATARNLARSGGVLDPRTRAIALNWARLAGTRPITILRHELTHLAVRELVGDAAVPAWVDEGLATLAEGGSGGTFLPARSAALLALAVGALRIDALTSREAWLDLDPVALPVAYAASAEAVRLIEERLGPGGLTRALALTGRLGGFAAGFAQEADEPLAAMLARVPALVRRDAEPRPLLGGAHRPR